MGFLQLELGGIELRSRRIAERCVRTVACLRTRISHRTREPQRLAAAAGEGLLAVAAERHDADEAGVS